MFDFIQHGSIETHRYRSWFDAQPGSTNQCTFCGRVIRYCYAMHDRQGKTFLIGSCEFNRYRGTKQFAFLKAAQRLQMSLRGNVEHDLKLFNDKAEVRERRKAWAAAKREGEKKVRLWVMIATTIKSSTVKSEWLPKELYDLRQVAGEKPPRQYRRQTAAARWYEKQAQKIVQAIGETASISSTNPKVED
jgi:hypothetical protein